jgi:hypothetical protein
MTTSKDVWRTKQDLYQVYVLFRVAEKQEGRTKILLESVARDLYDKFTEPVLILERRYKTEIYSRSPDISPIKARQKIVGKLIKTLNKMISSDIS